MSSSLFDLLLLMKNHCTNKKLHLSQTILSQNESKFPKFSYRYDSSTTVTLLFSSSSNLSEYQQCCEFSLPSQDMVNARVRSSSSLRSLSSLKSFSVAYQYFIPICSLASTGSHSPTRPCHTSKLCIMVAQFCPCALDPSLSQNYAIMFWAKHQFLTIYLLPC